MPPGRPHAVLLDFDGPVCSVFSFHRAPPIAEAMQADEAFARTCGMGGPKTDDPMEVLRIADAAGASRAELERLDDMLEAWEERAVAAAEPTAGAHALIGDLVDSGRQVAIVTNNSASCVRAYLRRHDLPDLPIEGRRRGEPALMKPAPFVVLAACRRLGVEPAGAVLVGDSVSDIEAGRAAGTLTVGYANRPGKHERLVVAEADAVIDSLGDLSAALDRL